MVSIYRRIVIASIFVGRHAFCSYFLYRSTTRMKLLVNLMSVMSSLIYIGKHIYGITVAYGLADNVHDVCYVTESLRSKE